MKSHRWILAATAAWAVALAAPVVLAAEEMPTSPEVPAPGDSPTHPGVDNPPLPEAVPPRPEQGRAAMDGGEEYIVKEGDTLSEIAEQKLGDPSKWMTIAKANDLPDPNRLAVGQRLVIPPQDDTAPAPVSAPRSGERERQMPSGEPETMPDTGEQR